MAPRFVLLSALIVTVLGCQHSRWALRDADYFHKYPEPAAPLDMPLAAKQAMDARYVEGKGGAYLGLAGQMDPGAIGGEIGLFGYPKSWLQVRGGLAGLASAGFDDSFGGINLAARLHPPSRLAPFVGVGMFHGVSRTVRTADSDWIDNDADGFIDEPGEEDWDLDGWMSAVYPEFGVRYWLDSDKCLSVTASYYFTTEGRAHDFWFFGVAFDLLMIRERWTERSSTAPLELAEHRRAAAEPDFGLAPSLSRPSPREPSPPPKIPPSLPYDSLSIPTSVERPL